MYRIEKKPWGFKLTFGDFIKHEEMNQWYEDAERELKLQSGAFGVFVDMRSLKPLPADAQKRMEDGQRLFKQKGLKRSAVILDSALTTMQFKRIAHETGIYQWERYIDASTHADWEKRAMDWLQSEVDPDTK